MSVYKRFRKKTVYEKFLIPKKIQKELDEMIVVKSGRYFPKVHKHYYFELSEIINDIIYFTSKIYYNRTHRINNSIIKTIDYIDEIINLSNTSIHIIQNYLTNRKLYKPETKNQKKIVNRFYKILEYYEKLINDFSNYKKSLIKKLNKQNN